MAGRDLRQGNAGEVMNFLKRISELERQVAALKQTSQQLLTLTEIQAAQIAALNARKKPGPKPKEKKE